MGRNIVKSGLNVVAMGLVIATLNTTGGTRSVDPLVPRNTTETNGAAVLPQREKLDFKTGPQTKVE